MTPDDLKDLANLFVDYVETKPLIENTTVNLDKVFMVPIDGVREKGMKSGEISLTIVFTQIEWIWAL